MCVTMRGAAFFGASIHLAIGMIYLVGFVIDVAGLMDVWNNPHATYLSLILTFIYICLFLLLGILIFRGVEFEAPKVLKGSISGFVVLQLSALLVHLGLLVLIAKKPRGETQFDETKNANSTSFAEIMSKNSTIGDFIDLINTSVETGMEEMTNSTLTPSDAPNDFEGFINLNQILWLSFNIIASVIYMTALIFYIRGIAVPESRPGRRH